MTTAVHQALESSHDDQCDTRLRCLEKIHELEKELALLVRRYESEHALRVEAEAKLALVHYRLKAIMPKDE